MYFESLTEIVNMAGHGIYVWTTYTVSLLALTALVILPARQYRKDLSRLRQQSEFDRH